MTGTRVDLFAPPPDLHSVVEVEIFGWRTSCRGSDLNLGLEIYFEEVDEKNLDLKTF